MRLLEVFLLLERTDRLNYIAQNMQKKILDRWTKHIEQGGVAGLPREWKEAYHGGVLPDPSWRGNKDKEKDNWTDELAKSGTEWIVEWFSQLDPTSNKKHTDWIIRQWTNGQIWLEDVPKLRNILETFEEHKKNLHKVESPDFDNLPPPERRSDLNAWKDYRVLATILRPLTGVQAAGEKVSNFLKKPEIQDYINHPVPDPVKAFGRDGDFDFDDLRSNYVDENGEDNFDTMDWYNGFTSKPDEDATTAIKPIYKSDRLAILQPNTEAAACELGKGTEWCTAYTEADNAFWTYAPNGPIYVILTDKMGKFQFHFDSNQFKDVHDDEISEDVKKQLVDNYPELKQIFATQAIHPMQGEDWLVDPSVWTLGRIKEFIAEGDESDLRTMLHKIRQWKDELPEETLQYLEALARKKSPASAWGFLRNPTEEDFVQSILANVEEGTPDTNYFVANTVGHAIAHGFPLDDSVIEAALDANALTLQNIPVERIRENPDWVIRALREPDNGSTLFRGAVTTTIENGGMSGLDTRTKMNPEQAQAVLEIVREHPAGKEIIDKYSFPEMVIKFRDYFGTEPWMKAYSLAQNNIANSAGRRKVGLAQRMAEAIFNNFMRDLDYKALITYLMKNGITHLTTYLAIEQAMGELPLDVQQELFKISPTTLLSLEKPHNRLKYLANKQALENSNDHRAKQSKAWADENAAAKAHTDAGGDPWEFKHNANESITEGVSPVLYHVSQISNIRDMLTDNAIRLTPDFGTGAEKEHQPEGKIYYLSTARSKTGGYGYPVSEHQKQGAMVVFDGRALMADGYTGKAVDYWGPEFRKLGNNEMEDRIFSKKPVIPKASKYIKEIHILLNTDNEYASRSLKDLGYKAKRLGIPLYIYTDSEAFGLLNKAKAASVATVDSTADRLPLPGTDVEPRGYRSGPPRNYFGGWIELLKVNDASQLSKAGKDALNRAHYFDANQGVDADIHNARTNSQRPHLDKFLAVLQQFKINSTTELMAYVNNKFN